MNNTVILTTALAFVGTVFLILRHIRDNKKGLHEQLYQQKIISYKYLAKASAELYLFVFKTYTIESFENLTNDDHDKRIIEVYNLLTKNIENVQLTFYENSFMLNKRIQDNLNDSVIRSREIHNKFKNKEFDIYSLKLDLDQFFKISVNELIKILR